MGINVTTLDLNFLGIPGAIAAYLIRHPGGAILVECGPGSTLPALLEGLKRNNIEVSDLTDVLLTHIHLDHAGAAGWLAHQGARIHVHPNGAPHLLNPEKLLASAARIYGDQMASLWGEFLAVPPEQLSVLNDGELVNIQGLTFKPLDTPGHADHHYAYIIENICFSGDIGGVRLTDTRHIRLPMPPPEFHLGKWRASLARLTKEQFSIIAPTHFGYFSDPEWHLSSLGKALEGIEAWIETIMPGDPEVSEINQRLSKWAESRAVEDGVPVEKIQAYESANPTWMSGYGIQRYWRKYRSIPTKTLNH